MTKIRTMLLIVCLVVPAWTATADASPEPHDLRGSWTGRATSDGGGHSVELDLMEQVGRRFTGVLRFGDTDPMRVDGTQSASGRVSIVGGDGGHHVVLVGRISDVEIVPCVFEGRYRLQTRGGSFEAGDVRLTHLDHRTTR
jgi:hypothetical protein